MDAEAAEASPGAPASSPARSGPRGASQPHPERMRARVCSSLVFDPGFDFSLAGTCVPEPEPPELDPLALEQLAARDDIHAPAALKDAAVKYRQKSQAELENGAVAGTLPLRRLALLIVMRVLLVHLPLLVSAHDITNWFQLGVIRFSMPTYLVHTAISLCMLGK